MMLRENGYIDYLILNFFSGQSLPIYKGGNINNGFLPKKNQILSNLKLINFEGNIEGFK
jgi:hypothetical protein